MKNHGEIKMVAVESTEEANPAAFENALRLIANMLVNEYRRRHSANSAPAAPQRAVTEPPEAADARLLDVDGLAKYLSLPKATIYTWVSMRRFPAKAVVRLGRALRFDRQEIDEWIATQRATR